MTDEQRQEILEYMIAQKQLLADFEDVITGVLNDA